jgi:hypothetical protein
MAKQLNAHLDVRYDSIPVYDFKVPACTASPRRTFQPEATAGAVPAAIPLAPASMYAPSPFRACAVQASIPRRRIRKFGMVRTIARSSVPAALTGNDRISFEEGIVKAPASATLALPMILVVFGTSHERRGESDMMDRRCTISLVC